MTENRRRLLGISLLGGAVVLAIALITWLLTTGGGPKTTDAAAPPIPTPSASPSATATPTPTPKAARTSHNAGGGGSFGQGNFGPGWGWAASAAKHTLVIEMISTRPVAVKMGWKVPQSTPKGGQVTGRMAFWSHAFTVYGPPKYAAFYIYYGGTVTTVSCRITLDGTTRIEKTTSGKYGALMCVG